MGAVLLTFKFKNSFISFVVSVFAFTLVGNSFLVNGQTESERKRDELRSQNDEISKSLSDTKSKLEEKMAQKKDLDDQIATVQGEINSSFNSIASLDGEIEEKKQNIKVLEKDIEKNQELFRKGVNLLFKLGGEVSAVSILLSCQNPQDLLSSIQMMSSLNKHQNKIIESLNASGAKVAAEKHEMEDKKEAVMVEKKILESRKSELDELIAENEKLSSELKEKEQQQTKQLDLNSAEIKSLDSEISEYYAKQEERKKQEESRRNSTAVTNNSEPIYTQNSSGTGYVWPTPGFTIITSTFDEWRGSSIHGALDIGGCGIYGTPVVAAQSGTVIRAVDGCRHYSQFCRCGGGYGNYVVIDHGNGLSTLYAHQCRIIVHEGQSVQKGQIIGYVGSTGFSSGPHLHFETRRYVNGRLQRYNPMEEY